VGTEVVWSSFLSCEADVRTGGPPGSSPQRGHELEAIERREATRTAETEALERLGGCFVFTPPPEDEPFTVLTLTPAGVRKL
jgi:hypothetical protein